MKKALINYIKKGPQDEVYTPECAIIPLIKYLPKNAIIWECTDYGSSNITKILKDNGFKVISTHKNNFDFLTDDPEFDFDIIITNPPYSLKDEFLKKCYEYKKPFALLLPLTALEGIKRNALYKKYGLNLIVFDKRINFLNQKKNNWFNTSWFTYKIDLGYENGLLRFEELKQ